MGAEQPIKVTRERDSMKKKKNVSRKYFLSTKNTQFELLTTWLKKEDSKKSEFQNFSCL